MHVPVRHILPMTLIRRERTLPIPGKVLMRAGQKAAPLDALAEANLTPEYILLDVAGGLGVSAEKADRLLQRQIGDSVAQGDIIAGPVGLARRLIRSPRDGKIVLTGGGQALIETSGKPFQLKAAVPGDVVDLLPDYGAVIETGGALIQGMWGNGKLEYGPLRIQVKAPDEEARAAEIDVSLRGTILMAGYCRDEEVLQIVDELPLRGLILSSMDARLIPAAQRVSVPVILMEGFGRRAYNPLIYKLLTTNEQRSTAVNAQPWNAYTGACPEIIIPMPTPINIAEAQHSAALVIGATVRIVRQPGLGEIGQVVAMNNSAAMPNGLRVRAAEVLLDNGQTQLVPVANLEILA